MIFAKKVPEWKNVGAEPPEDIKKDGFKAGYKPPAAYFNWFFNRISESTKELQDKLSVDDGDKLNADGGDISNTVIQSLDDIVTEFPVPVAGESAKTFLGKVKKFFEDTKNWMTGVCMLGQLVNDCVTNRSDLPLAAAQGKVLMDLYTQLNSDLNVRYNPDNDMVQIYYGSWIDWKIGGLQLSQIINYTMLYDKGDECIGITGDWVKSYAKYGSSGTFTKNATDMYLKAATGSNQVNCGGATANDINTNGYTGAYINVLSFSGNGPIWGWSENTGLFNAWDTGKVLAIGLNKAEVSPNYHKAIIHSSSQAGGATVNLVFMVKNDDWMALAEIAGITATSMEDLLIYSSVFLSILSAVKFMCLRCTGNFMVQAIQSSAFIDALNHSPYRSIVRENTHWNKFLTIL